MKTISRNRRGISLLDAIVATMLFAMVTVFTMHSLAQSRLLRAHARERAEMALLAQTQLDRARRVPISAFLEGAEVTALDSATTATIALHPAQEGLWSIDVTIDRSRDEGVYTTTLAALYGGPER